MKIILTKYATFIIASLLLLIACNKSELDNSLSQKPTYRDYYPVSAGKEMIYQLDSIVPAPFGVRLLTRTYYIKDVVATLNTSAKDSTYKINRYIATQSDAAEWNYQYSYTATLKLNTLEIVEKENVNQEEPIPVRGLTDLRFVKLTNPIHENIKWDGNRYFTLGNVGTASFLYKYNGWEYIYKNIQQPKETPAGTFNNTITVIGSDQLYGDTNIETPAQYQQRIYSEEVYAAGTGLVYKFFIYSDFQPSNSGSPGYQAKSFGIRLKLVSVKQ